MNGSIIYFIKRIFGIFFYHLSPFYNWPKIGYFGLNRMFARIIIYLETEWSGYWTRTHSDILSLSVWQIFWQLILFSHYYLLYILEDVKGLIHSCTPTHAYGVCIQINVSWRCYLFFSFFDLLTYSSVCRHSCHWSDANTTSFIWYRHYRKSIRMMEQTDRKEVTTHRWRWRWRWRWIDIKTGSEKGQRGKQN